MHYCGKLPKNDKLATFWGHVKKAGVCVKLWLAGIYFLVHAIFVASKLWIWQQFKDNKIKKPYMPNSMGLDTY